MKYKIVDIDKNDAFHNDLQLIGQIGEIVTKNKELKDGYFSGKFQFDTYRADVVDNGEYVFACIKLEEIDEEEEYTLWLNQLLDEQEMIDEETYEELIPDDLMMDFDIEFDEMILSDNDEGEN